jgi:ketosteroid isomerase-like protein
MTTNAKGETRHFESPGSTRIDAMDRPAVIREVYDEWKRGNYAAGRELYDPAMTMEIHSPIPEAGVYEGLEGLQRYMRGFLGTWKDYKIEAVGLEEHGDTILIRVHHGGEASGAWVESEFSTAWTFRGETVARIDTAEDNETALEAAQRWESEGS